MFSSISASASGSHNVELADARVQSKGSSGDNNSQIDDGRVKKTEKRISLSILSMLKSGGSNTAPFFPKEEFRQTDENDPNMEVSLRYASTRRINVNVNLSQRVFHLNYAGRYFVAFEHPGSW